MGSAISVEGPSSKVHDEATRSARQHTGIEPGVDFVTRKRGVESRVHCS